MSTNVKNAAKSSNRKKFSTLLGSGFPAMTAEENLIVHSGFLGLLLQALGGQEDNLDDEFRKWVGEQAKTMKMKEASNLLNKNAWKIDSIQMYPAFGDDPETEWTCFLGTISDDEFRVDCDDYREALKKFAIISEILDLGE